ncbi:MAG: hypothetical protein ACKO3R_09525 [bacterium]
MFENELKTFKENLATLRERNPLGGFVVIKDSEILGVWVNRQDALAEGFKKYGSTPYLIKNINEQDFVLNFSREVFSSTF